MPQRLKLTCICIKRDNAPLILHRSCKEKCLTTSTGACINDALTRLGIELVASTLRCYVLLLKPTHFKNFGCEETKGSVYAQYVARNPQWIVR